MYELDVQIYQDKLSLSHAEHSELEDLKRTDSKFRFDMRDSVTNDSRIIKLRDELEKIKLEIDQLKQENASLRKPEAIISSDSRLTSTAWLDK